MRLNQNLVFDAKIFFFLKIKEQKKKIIVEHYIRKPYMCCYIALYIKINNEVIQF